MESGKKTDNKTAAKTKEMKVLEEKSEHSPKGEGKSDASKEASNSSVKKLNNCSWLFPDGSKKSITSDMTKGLTQFEMLQLVMEQTNEFADVVVGPLTKQVVVSVTEPVAEPSDE